MSPRASAGPRGTVGLHEFIVMANEEVAKDAYRLEISSSVSQGLEAGQFINIAVPGDATHILRIPLSFSRTDPANARVELFYAIVGEGTRRLSAMRAGAVSTAVGPCGKGWRLPDEPAARCLLVAGGIGLPPIFAAAEMLARAGVRFDAIVGAQTEAKLVFPLIHDLERLVAVLGRHGLVSVGLEKTLQEDQNPNLVVHYQYFSHLGAHPSKIREYTKQGQSIVPASRKRNL